MLKKAGIVLLVLVLLSTGFGSFAVTAGVSALMLAAFVVYLIVQLFQVFFF